MVMVTPVSAIVAVTVIGIGIPIAGGVGVIRVRVSVGVRNAYGYTEVHAGISLLRSNEHQHG
jgi:hypothetical protein